MMDQEQRQLPFFVYGTLLPGQPNYYLWEQSIASEIPAWLPNGRLYDLGSYPLLIETGDRQVKGMLVEIQPAVYRAVIARLDYLEGFDAHDPEGSEYVRAARMVYLEDDTTVTAWVYIGQGDFVNNLPIVHNGDWIGHVEHRREQLDTWWQNINSVSGLHDDLT